ncbi:MAG: HEPN domain-containing protein [Bryobacteraceae bacterium]|jgi:HEPN domain-containing protein
MAPPDPVLLENTRDWLARAREDLETAALALTPAQPMVRSALFHCQQAVEKTMKAFLTWRDVPFRTTHNLVELGDDCVAVDAGLLSAVERVTSLTKYATRFRYPGAPYEPEVEEAQQALEIARAFIADLAIYFPAEVRSAGGLPGSVPPPDQ